MQISLANAKKLNWLWQDENEIAWIETFIKAVDKSGKETEYRLTPEQKSLVNGLDESNLVIKARINSLYGDN